MASFVSGLNSNDPDFANSPDPIIDIAQVADDIRRLANALGDCFGQEGATILGRMDGLNTLIEGKVKELKEFWEARIKVAEEEVKDLKIQMKVVEGREAPSPFFSKHAPFPLRQTH